ncbi:DUF4405 domain-containing protein [Carboxylicivirga sp. N1Y90]|uniref:DUF4405 domain-containing protein n=1 Tax=Carboxylicivirga fragile TaxID=3417571 RepID=UPI003D33FFCB|nr:DUF4405 domain-containing protein [Marinilabiliaceae bacterium N1Y90]
MKKSTINYFIDALLLLCLCAITGIGILIKYTLPPGRSKWAEFGSNHNMLWLNMDRHQWGQIHFIISMVLIALLVFHIALHWSFVTNVTKRLIKSSSIKIVYTALFITLSALFISFPFFVSPTLGSEFKHSQHLKVNSETAVKTHEATNETIVVSDVVNVNTSQVTKHASHKDSDHRYQSHEINGRMTLQEVAETYNVPLSFFKKELELPDGIDHAAKLGRLRKQYGFHMSDVDKVIEAYHN